MSKVSNALIEQVHNAGTFATGLLAGGFSYVYQDAPPEMLAKTEQWCGKSRFAPFHDENRSFAQTGSGQTK